MLRIKINKQATYFIKYQLILLNTGIKRTLHDLILFRASTVYTKDEKVLEKFQ